MIEQQWFEINIQNITIYTLDSSKTIRILQKKNILKLALDQILFMKLIFYLRIKLRKISFKLSFPKKKKLLKIPEKDGNDDEDDQKKQMGEQILEKWIFEFSYDIKQFVEAAREAEKQKRRTLSKIAPKDDKNYMGDDSDKSLSQNSRLKEKKISNDDEHEKNIEEYVLSIQKTKSALKAKAEVQQQQAERLRKIKQKELAEKRLTSDQNEQQLTYGIASFWREYFKDYEQVIKKQLKPLSVNEKIQRQLTFLSDIQYFNNAAQKIVQNYVNQKLAGNDPEKYQFENFYFYKGIWLKHGGKQLNQQFLVNYYLNDIFYSLKEVKGYNLRLPLMSLIQYKGFKILCMCDMPFNQIQNSQVYNLFNDSCDLQLMGKLKQCFQIVQDILNVKSQAFQIQPNRKVNAPLGKFLKVFEYSFKKDKSQDMATLPQFYYLMNIGMIFPLDFNFQMNKINMTARLRPQIVALFRDYYTKQDPQLLAQAFMISTMPSEYKLAEDQKVIKACNMILEFKIPELLDRLYNLQLIFVDSFSIKSILQQMGINIRYISIIYERSQLPYVKQMLLCEALARTIKKQFRQVLKEIYSENLVQKKKEIAKYTNAMKNNYIRQLKYSNQIYYKQIAIDYLNLIFGSGEETVEFWKIIISRCSQQYKISTTFPLPVNPGCLLNAVLWNCSLTATFGINIPLFKSLNPFQSIDSIDYRAKIKTFDFPSFQIQKQFRKTPDQRTRQDIQLFKQASSKLLKLQLLFNKTLRNTDIATQATLSKLNMFHEYIDKPKAVSQCHPIQFPYYISNKSPYNFQKAIELLNFSLPNDHPLYVSLYLEYSNLIQPELLKKSALMMAVKSFGQFHPKTTEIYSQLYNEGYTQYKMKAKRVKDIHSCEVMSEQMYQSKMYQSCLAYVIEQINKINDKAGWEKLSAGNFKSYLNILMQGLDSSIRTSELDKGILISKQMSMVINSFKLQDKQITQILFRQSLIIHLLRSNKKYFLYKMVLFAIHIKKSYEIVKFDEQGCTLPCTGPQRDKILEGLQNQYFEHENHSNWIEYIVSTITKSFQYFNFLDDLFNNFQHHLSRYNNQDFKICLGYYDILIRLFGQKLFKDVLYDIRLN